MHRTLSRMLMAAALVATFVAGAGANALWRSHPERLDGAIESLTKADALLDAAASQLPDDFSEKGRKAYDKYFDKAKQAMQDLLDAIDSMIQAAEGG